MAQRVKSKPKHAASRTAEPSASGADAARLAARLQSVERERDALRSELAAAQARIVDLDKARTQALNRMEWVIDSLQNVLDKGS